MQQQATAKRGWHNRWRGPALTSPRYRWLLVAGCLLFLYYATYSLLSRMPLPTDVNMYGVQPLLWSSLAVLCLWLWRRERRDAAFPVSRGIMLTAILVGVFQIALFVLAGVLAGFGESPYAHRPHVIALNVLYVGTRLGGQEMARWYLVFSLGRRNTFLGLVIAWALLWVVTVPLSQFGNLTSLEAGFPTLGRTLLPSASEGMLATYLVLLGGPLASIAYRGTLAVFEWLSPILPNLRWTLYAFLGVLAPTLGLLIVRDLAKWRASDIEERQGAREVPKRSTGTAWVLLATFAVSLFWFNTGLFGVRPDLITGVSMEPTMKAGDIAISRDVSPREVDVGDIVRFRQDGVYVLHRVVEVNRERGRYVFTTKGDNSTLDDAVDESQLEGRVVACVPKVGWPVLFVKKLLFRLVR